MYITVIRYDSTGTSPQADATHSQPQPDKHVLHTEVLVVLCEVAARMQGPQASTISSGTIYTKEANFTVPPSEVK